MKTYETPVIEITSLDAQDILTVSVGETPYVTYEW